VGAFQRQVSGQPELGLVRGLANELEKFGLGARPIGTAVVQQFSAEFQCGLRRLYTQHKITILIHLCDENSKKIIIIIVLAVVAFLATIVVALLIYLSGGGGGEQRQCSDSATEHGKTMHRDGG